MDNWGFKFEHAKSGRAQCRSGAMRCPGAINKGEVRFCEGIMGWDFTPDYKFWHVDCVRKSMCIKALDNCNNDITTLSGFAGLEEGEQDHIKQVVASKTAAKPPKQPKQGTKRKTPATPAEREDKEAPASSGPAAESATPLAQSGENFLKAERTE